MGVTTQPGANASSIQTSGIHHMSISTGRLLVFDSYLDAAKKSKPDPCHWRWPNIEATAAHFARGERGTLALVSGSADAGVEAAPGVSMALQAIYPGERTTTHTHSFWHLYIVLAGTGSACVGAEEDTALAVHDVLYVPPWTHHAFSNDGKQPLLLYALQNLPQLAQLDTLARSIVAGEVEAVYRSGSQRVA
jgi:gentisate 1,2-dioxygenase